MVNELIKYKADVDKLYQLVGMGFPEKSSKSDMQQHNDYILCRACGKKLNVSTKFCNYCGQKVEK